MREADVELSQEYALHEDAPGICKWLVCDVMGLLVLRTLLYVATPVERIYTRCLSVCPSHRLNENSILLYASLSTHDVCLSVHT